MPVNKLNIPPKSNHKLRPEIPVEEKLVAGELNALLAKTDELVDQVNGLDLNKVDKVTGKQLSTEDFSSAEKTKLAGIAANANNYVHPQTHSASMIDETTTRRFVSDTEKATWNSKANGVHSHTIADLPVATSGTSSNTQVVRADDSRLSDTRTPKTHTHVIGDVTGLQTELNLKAPLASPSFTGTPTVPTAAVGTNNTQAASTAFVQTAVANVQSGGGGGDMMKAIYDANNNGKVDVAENAEVVPWTGVSDKPTTFPPIAHAHTIADLPVATSGTSSTTQVVRADDLRLSNARTPTTHSHTIADLPVAPSGTVSSTQVVRADDARLSNARTPTAHSHTIADLPVATSGTVSTTQVVRADDLRLSNARTPTAHTHAISEVTDLQNQLNLKAPLASPALTGTPTGPTAAPGTNTTQLATTAFVQAAAQAAGSGDMLKSTYDANNNGKVDSAENADAVPWSGVTSKPATFAPSAHSHTIGDLPVATSGTVSTTQVVRADDLRLSNARTPTAHTHTIADLPVATSGTSSTTQVVRADDARLSNARTPTAHTHVIGDLPVATSGTVSATQVVRADDLRLSNARTPTAHTHIIGDVTNLQAELNLKAPLASPTFTGTPAVPTATTGANTTQAASTAFVQNTINATETWFNSATLSGIGTQADPITVIYRPTNLTQTQRTALVSPPLGLMVYQTNGTEGLYINKSTGWTFIG
jgi:hypothetical protein